MRLLLALLALALLVLGVRWIAERPAASRASPRRAPLEVAEPEDGTPAANAPRPIPAPLRTAASSEGEPTTAPETDAFPRSRLAGRVEHADGTPAAGIALEVRASSQRAAARPLAELRTDADGSFEASVLGGGPFRLRIHESSGGGTRLEVHEPVEAGASQIFLRLPRTGRLRGRVVDERGEPVTSFALELRRAEEVDVEDEEERKAGLRLPITSPDGTFESAELAQGRWWLAVTAEGHVPAQERCWIPATETLVLRLARAARLSGVVRGRDGQPRAGARVELSSAREPVFAGADGSFRIAGGSGTVRLRARDPASLDGPALELVVAPGEERAGLVLSLGASGEISGQVIGHASRPAVGRLVSFRPLPEGTNRESLAPCETDALGRFRVEAPPGLWEISVALTREEIEVLELAAEAEERVLELRATEQVQVEANAVSELWLALAPAPVRVSGTLTKAGEPCAGGTLVATDSRGDLRYRARVEGSSYVLALARPGLYEVSVTFGGTTQRLWVGVPAVGAHTLDLDVPVGWIEGFVRDRNGERVGDTKVWANAPPSAHGGGAAHALTAADGSFTLELAPGSYTVGAGEKQAQDYPWSRADGLQVQAGKRRTGLELVLPSASAGPALTVVLRGPRGELVNAARVDLAGGPYERPPPGGAAPQGSVEFGLLPPGEYEVWAEAPGYLLREPGRIALEWNRPKRLELSLVSTREVVLSVPATYVSGIDVDAVDTSGRVFASTRGAASDDGAQAPEPQEVGLISFHFAGLPAGDYRLRVFTGDRVLEQPLHVVLDEVGPLRAPLSVPSAR